MKIFFDLILFDREKIIQFPILKKKYACLYVISLVLLTSLLVVVLKTFTLNLDNLQKNVGYFNSIKDIDNSRVYQDGLNTIDIENDILIINGNEVTTLSKLKNNFEIKNIKDLQETINNNRNVISFIFFIYEYIVSLRYIVLFILLLLGISLTTRIRLKLSHEITMKECLTYTSYILTIPILISMLLRLLNFRFSYSVMMLVVLTIILEFMFIKKNISIKTQS